MQICKVTQNYCPCFQYFVMLVLHAKKKEQAVVIDSKCIELLLSKSMCIIKIWQIHEIFFQIEFSNFTCIEELEGSRTRLDRGPIAFFLPPFRICEGFYEMIELHFCHL